MWGYQMASIKTVEKKTHSVCTDFPSRATVTQDLFGEVQIHFWLRGRIVETSSGFHLLEATPAVFEMNICQEQRGTERNLIRAPLGEEHQPSCCD